MLSFPFKHRILSLASSDRTRQDVVARGLFALQIMCAFLFSAIITYKTSLSTRLTTPYLVPLIATMMIQQTVGLTFLGCVGLLCTLTPVCIFLYLVQMGVGYRDYGPIAMLIFLVSFVVSYASPTMQQRKMPLIISIIFLTSLCNTPSQYLPTTFAFELLEAIAIGQALALATALAIFPSTAVGEIHFRMGEGLRHFHRAIQQMVDTSCCVCEADPIGCKVRHTRCLASLGGVAVSMRANHQVMKSLLPDSQGEFPSLLRRVTGWSLLPQQEVEFIAQMSLYTQTVRALLEELLNLDDHEEWSHLHQNLEHWFKLQGAIIECVIQADVTDRKGKIAGLLEAVDQLHSYPLISGVPRDSTASDGEESASGLLAGRWSATKRAATHHHMRSHLLCSSILFVLRQCSLALALYCDLTHPGVDADKTSVMRSPPLPSVPLLARLFALVWPLNVPRLVSALRSSIIMSIGAIFVLIPSLAARFEQGTWILTAMAMTQGNSQGGAFLTMRNRLFGTLLGCIWAYVCYLAVGDVKSYKFFGMMMIWIPICTVVRFSPSWAYAGTIATVTPIIIQLGNTVGAENPADYAFLRTKENILGIIFGAALNLLLLPISASDLLHLNISKSMERAALAMQSMQYVCKHCHTDLSEHGGNKNESEDMIQNDIMLVVFHMDDSDGESFTSGSPTIADAAESPPLDERKTVYAQSSRSIVRISPGPGGADPGDQAKSTSVVASETRTDWSSSTDPLLLALYTLVEQQGLLIEETTAEPRLWFINYPLDVYRQIQVQCRKLTLALFMLRRGLTQDAQGSQSSHTLSNQRRSQRRDILSHVSTSMTSCQLCASYWASALADRVSYTVIDEHHRKNVLLEKATHHDVSGETVLRQLLQAVHQGRHLSRPVSTRVSLGEPLAHSSGSVLLLTEKLVEIAIQLHSLMMQTTKHQPVLPQV